MEPVNAGHAVLVGGLLAKMRSEHALTRELLAALLGTCARTFADWEEDRLPVPPATESKIAALSRRLSFASRAAWKFRIGAATRPELLMDAGLTVLAASPSMLTQRAADSGADVRLPTTFFVGRHINDVLPSLDCNLILTRGAGLSELRDIGFFRRRVRCVRIGAELNFGAVALHGVGEVWPVETVDAGVAAQLILHTNRSAKNTLRAPGVIVHWTQIVPVE